MEFLEKYHLIHSYTGLFHTVFAIISLIFGTMVLFNKKGDKTHKRRGYVYVFAMSIMIFSSFGLYMTGSFSMFHFFSIVSLITLLVGMIPALQRRKNWLSYHFYSMSWSVIGLYCAFWAEVGVRFFDMKYFWWVVMLATIGTSIWGNFYIKKQARLMGLD